MYPFIFTGGPEAVDTSSGRCLGGLTPPLPCPRRNSTARAHGADGLRRTSDCAVRKNRTLEYADLAPLAYLHIALEGGTKNYVKHLLIDEMQDYSPIQYKVMQKLFPCRKTVLGDASQSVNPYGSSTADMIQKALVTGEVMKLFKSYRSTYEITDFAQKIRTNTDLEPVARHGEKPKVLQFNNEKEELSAIKELIATYQASTCGIITSSNSKPFAMWAEMITIPCTKAELWLDRKLISGICNLSAISRACDSVLQIIPSDL